MRTKRALQQAALELFARDGYDTTTTDDVAERAGVSPRTFFRYFPTKESVLFVGESNWFEAFTARFLEQPAHLTDVEALRDTLLALAPELTRIRKSLLLYERAVASSPTLRGGVHDRQQEEIAAIADTIARRRGLAQADEGAVVLATVGLITYRRCLTDWLAGRARAALEPIIARRFELLAELFAPPRARRRASATRVARPQTTARTR